jgi:hypothetical protein
MKHKAYIPTIESDKRIWLDNFSNKLAVHATELNIDKATLDSTKADADYYGVLVDFGNDVNDYIHGLTLIKKNIVSGIETKVAEIPDLPKIPTNVAVLPGVFNRVRKLVGVIKKNPNLTNTMIQDLGIEGDEINTAFDDIKVDAKLSLKNGHAFLKWTHKGTDAVDIEADYGDGKGFTDVGRYIKISFMDPHLPTAGQSAAFVYRLRYVLNDEQVGVWCEPLSISVRGF